MGTKDQCEVDGVKQGGEEQQAYSKSVLEGDKIEIIHNKAMPRHAALLERAS